MSRISSRVNKGQYTSVRYGDEPDIQPAPKKTPKPVPKSVPKPVPKPAPKPAPQQPGDPNNVVAAIPVFVDNSIRIRDDVIVHDLTPYFKNYFYTPDDIITDRYLKLMEDFEKIPAIIAEGFANLEVKEPEPIKQIPLFSKLINGDYQTAQSKSDKNIATSIKFFFNNLPSFTRYKDKDELDWVVNNHRLLSYELLEYSKIKKSSLATLKTKFNAIARIMRLAFKSKKPDLYEKFSQIIIDLGDYIEDDEAQNELSPEEEKKFVKWEVVMAKQKELENKFYSLQNKQSKLAYEINNDLLLLSLYSLIPPLRNEIKHLNFTHSRKKDKDYIWFDNDGEILLHLNLEKKRHDPIIFNLTKDAPKLTKIIKDSYELYPREYVFTPKNTYPRLDKKASQASLDSRLSALFIDTDKNVSVNSLRSSYVSYMVHQGMIRGKLLSVKEKNKIAERMRSSRKYFDESYTKLFQLDGIQQNIQVKQEAGNNGTIDETSTYEKQKSRAKTYYYQHKDEIIKKQKEYQKKQGSHTNSRNRLLRFLNSSPDYEKTMRDTTKAKYNFKKVDGVWE